MAKQVFWEDVKEGTEIPSLVKKPTTQQLVRWAGASGDYHEIHYDKDYAISEGLPGVIVHGALKSAWLGQLLGDWAGEMGSVKRYSCSYRGMDVPGDTITIKGIVGKKYLEGNEHCVECDVWTENSKGDRTTIGKGVVVLPASK